MKMKRGSWGRNARVEREDGDTEKDTVEEDEEEVEKEQKKVRTKKGTHWFMSCRCSQLCSHVLLILRFFVLSPKDIAVAKIAYWGSWTGSVWFQTGRCGMVISVLGWSANVQWKLHLAPGWGVHSTAQQLRSIHGGNHHLTAGCVMRRGHFLLQLRRMKQMLFNHFHRNVGRKAPFVNLQIDALCGCDMKSCNHQIQNGDYHREHEWWKMMEDVESMVFRGYES